MLKGYQAEQGSTSRMATVQDVLDGMPVPQAAGPGGGPKDKPTEPFVAVDVVSEVSAVGQQLLFFFFLNPFLTGCVYRCISQTASIIGLRLWT